MTTLQAASTKVWLEYYDTIAEEIDDDILDYCDEKYNVDVLIAMDVELPDAYYVTAAQLFKARHGG